jgi:hypothetical protein
MKFYSYRYLKEGSSSLHIGLIAEEAPKEILGENKKSIDLYKFVSYIGIGVKAIAEKLQNITSSTIDFVSNAVSYVKELIAEKIIAKRARLDKIEMVDQYTGEIYCVWIENGEWKKVKGECDANSTINSQILESTSTQSTSTQENINNTSTTENASTTTTLNNTNSSDNNSNLNQNNSSNYNLLQSTEQNNIQQNDQNTNQKNSTNSE